MQLRILAVDSTAETLETFKTIATSLGYEVATCSNVREAAQRVSREKFDLVALAARMLQGDGFELAERVRGSASNRSVPILMLTEGDGGETVRRGFALGITFYLGKPIDPDRLRGLFSAMRGMVLQQRRRYIRLPVRVEVSCRRGEKQFRTSTIDLAQGGVLLETSGGLGVGDSVESEFSLPGVREPLKLMGKVVRKVPPDRIAIEFLEPERTEQAALQVFVVDRTSS